MFKLGFVFVALVFTVFAMQGTLVVTEAQTPVADPQIDAADQPGSDPTAPLAQIDYSIVVFNNSSVAAQNVVLTCV